jgi:mRNA interferase RelE/StbE
MKIEFTKSFVKDLNVIKDKSLLSRVKQIITQIEQSDSLQSILNVKYLVDSKYYYRIRVGDFRIGIKVENDIVNFIRFLHRKDIYKRFP